MKQSSLCPVFEKGMNVISKRWNGLIVSQLLEDGTLRFCTLETKLAISGRVLSERLKELEQEGIVQRDVYPEVPVRIEYSLTEKGEALRPIISGIEEWAQKWVQL